MQLALAQMAGSTVVKRYVLLGGILFALIFFLHSFWRTTESASPAVIDLSAKTPQTKLPASNKLLTSSQAADTIFKSKSSSAQSIKKTTIKQSDSSEVTESTTPPPFSLEEKSNDEFIEPTNKKKVWFKLTEQQDKQKAKALEIHKSHKTKVLTGKRRTDSSISKVFADDKIAVQFPKKEKDLPVSVGADVKVNKTITLPLRAGKKVKVERFKKNTTSAVTIQIPNSTKKKANTPVENLPPATNPQKIKLPSQQVKNKPTEKIKLASMKENPVKQIAEAAVDIGKSEHWIDGRAEGWNSTRYQSIDVTASFQKDPLLRNLSEFTIEPLVGFFRNETSRCNSDNTCYENWLADDMKFPPNAKWEGKYTTPCYTDYMTAKFRCFPHIFMVGWAKSGTTDMWWYWNNHQDLVHGQKETHFLTQNNFFIPGHTQMVPFDRLIQFFFEERSIKSQQRNPQQIMFDATATTIYDNWHWRIKQGYQGDPLVPTHTNFHYMRKVHPGAQIVVLMRNPTTRALSFYNHGIDMSIKRNANLNYTYTNMPKSPIDIHKFFVESIYYFNECVKIKSLRACCHMPEWESQNWGDSKYFMTLRIGIYYVFLEEVYKNYPTTQVYLVKSEEFYNTPVPALNDLYTFLHISTENTEKLVLKKGDSRVLNIPKYFTPLPETYRLLQEFYAPFNLRLSEMLGDDKWLEWELELDDKLTGASNNKPVHINNKPKQA